MPAKPTLSAAEILAKYLPEGTADAVLAVLVSHDILLKIKRSRSTKWGDSRPALPGRRDVITVNENLNRYAFLIITMHEVAHILAIRKYGRKIKPHGDQWKQEYRLLLIPFLLESVFPLPLLAVLQVHLTGIRASVHADTALLEALRKYDLVTATITVGSLNDQDTFRTQNGRVFKVIGKMRKRLKCQCLVSGRLYLFSPLAEVWLEKRA
ncbi:MAG: sprT domain-containing protein [Bacteroidetes bacterium]|nr:sprT domain-containing protein [Bacteroidota bacterium]